MKEFDLTGRTAWVTGAGKGLGRAMATALAAAGATVAVTSRTRADRDSLAAELGQRTVVLPGSVAEPGFAEASSPSPRCTARRASTGSRRVRPARALSRR